MVCYDFVNIVIIYLVGVWLKLTKFIGKDDGSLGKLNSDKTSFTDNPIDIRRPDGIHDCTECEICLKNWKKL